ncbi:MAG: LacI family DNA-binding transcriptional regulator [Spirochaetota bacterium]
MRRSPSTIRDIARLAGVGTTSVSKFFSGKGYLGADTRTRIEAAVKKTDYRINKSASLLKSRTSREIAVIIPEREGYKSYARDHFMGRKFGAAMEASFKLGYDLLLVYAPTGAAAFDTIVRTHSFAGVIFMETPPEHFIETLTRFRIPYVLSNFTSIRTGDPPLVKNGVNGVVSDFRTMFADIFTFAVQRGYTCLGFSGMTSRAIDAKRIISDLFKKHGMSDCSAHLPTGGGKTDISGILSAAKRAKTLVIIEHRSLAVQFYLDTRGTGAGIGLLAMDNFPEFDIFQPQISHIEQDIDGIATGCLSMLTDMINEHVLTKPAVTVPVRIIERGTT